MREKIICFRTENSFFPILNLEKKRDYFVNGVIIVWFRKFSVRNSCHSFHFEWHLSDWFALSQSNAPIRSEFKYEYKSCRICDVHCACISLDCLSHAECLWLQRIEMFIFILCFFFVYIFDVYAALTLTYHTWVNHIRHGLNEMLKMSLLNYMEIYGH